jgi:hypothetical protein
MTGHQRRNAPVQRGIVRHPAAVSVTARVLTAPVVRSALAGGWSLYWNDLVDGAQPSAHRRVAVTATRLISAATRRSRAE